MRANAVALVLSWSLAGNIAIAQLTTSVDSVGACNYRLCALTIVPTWNGLSVVRETSGAAVANLNFFFPRDISHALDPEGRRFVGSDSVNIIAHRALQLRRIGAALTDVGLIATTVAGMRALSSRSNKHTNGMLAAAGLVSMAVAVPFQFAADGALSRSVWWYNLRYSDNQERPAQ